MLNVPAPVAISQPKSAGAAGVRLTRLGSAGFASFGLLAWSTTSWAVRVDDDGDQHIPRLRSFIAFPAAARPPNRSRQAAPPTTRTTDGGSRHTSLWLLLYNRLGRACYYKALLICALIWTPPLACSWVCSSNCRRSSSQHRFRATLLRAWLNTLVSVSSQRRGIGSQSRGAPLCYTDLLIIGGR